MKRTRFIGIILVLVVVLIVLCSYLVVMVWWRSTYDSESNNCVDMSYRLAPVFHGLGFDTKIVYGASNDSSVAHCWLSVNGLYFDATSLWFNDEAGYPVIMFVDKYPFGYTDELMEAKQR